MNQTTEQHLKRIAAFLRANNPHRRDQPDEKLVPWLEWYWNDARIGVIQEKGEIVCVALVRLLEMPKQADQEWFTTEHGQIVWVDDIVSRHNQGIHFLLEIAKRRFGPREMFAGQVFYREGELRMLPWGIVERLADRIRSHEHEHSGATGAA